MDRKRSLQEVMASAVIADCFKRFKTGTTEERDHDEELIHELEDGRSAGHSRMLILSQYWQTQVETPIGGGEPATQTRFTSRYRALSPSLKLRLLEITQCDEIATDLLKTSFATMGVPLQLELLRLSPYHKTEIGTNIMLTQFQLMSDDLRMRFLEVAPKNILVTMLEKHTEWMSVREALAAAYNLEERQYADIRRTTSELIWRRKEICDVDDLVKLGQIILPKFGREIVAEIKNRCKPAIRKQPSNLCVFENRAVETAGFRPNRASSLAILFPTLMAQCYHVANENVHKASQLIGHGPLVSIPSCIQDSNPDRLFFGIDLVVDWASAEYGFIHILLARELGEFIEAAVVISDGIDRQFDVGVIDDDSPSLEIPWPLPGLGTPSCVQIRAHLQQTEPEEEEEQLSECDELQVPQSNQTDHMPAVLISQSANRSLSIDAVLQSLISQGAMTDIEQHKLRLVCTDPRLKSFIDLIIERATANVAAVSNT